MVQIKFPKYGSTRLDHLGRDLNFILGRASLGGHGTFLGLALRIWGLARNENPIIRLTPQATERGGRRSQVDGYG